MMIQVTVALLFLMVIGMLSINFFRGCDFIYKLWAFFIGFPIFINIGGPSRIGLGRSIFESSPVGQTVPLSFFIMVGLILLISLKNINNISLFRTTLTSRLFFLMSIISFVLLLIGLFDKPNIENIIFFLQFLAPFFAYIIAESLSTNKEKFISYLKLMTLGSFSGILLLTISNIVEFGISIITTSQSYNDKIFFLNVYQIYDYYPVTVAITAILLFVFSATANKPSIKIMYLSQVIISVIALTHLNARNALLLFLIGSFLTILFSRLGIVEKLFVSLFSVLGIGFLFTTDLPVFNRLNTADTSVRVVRMKEGLEFFFNHPVFGAFFKESEVTGFHNQFLEIATRGGVFVIMIFVMIFIIHIWKSIKYNHLIIEGSFAILFTAITSIIIAVMIGSNIAQSNMTQPYTAIFLWFLLGLQGGLLKTDINGHKNNIVEL